MINTIEKLRKEAYRLYQLDWFQRHGYSLLDIAKYLQEQLEIEDSVEEIRSINDILLENTFNEWEEETGFNGEIYVCYQEFLDCEYRETDYMNELFNVTGDPGALKELYKLDIRNKSNKEPYEAIEDILTDKISNDSVQKIVCSEEN